MADPQLIILSNRGYDYIGHAKRLYANQETSRKVYILDRLTFIVEKGGPDRVIVYGGIHGIGCHPRFGASVAKSLRISEENYAFVGKVIDNFGITADKDGKLKIVTGDKEGPPVSVPPYPPGELGLHAVLPLFVEVTPKWSDINDDVYMDGEQGYGSLYAIDDPEKERYNQDFEPTFYSWHGPIGGTVDTVTDHTFGYEGNYQTIFKDHMTPFRSVIYSGGEIDTRGFACGWENNERAMVVNVRVEETLIRAVLCISLAGSDGWGLYKATPKTGNNVYLITNNPIASAFGLDPDSVAAISPVRTFGGTGFLYFDAYCFSGNSDGEIYNAGWQLSNPVMGGMPRQPVSSAANCKYTMPMVSESTIMVRNEVFTDNAWYDTDYQLDASGEGWLNEANIVPGVTGTLITTSKDKSTSSDVEVDVVYNNFCVDEISGMTFALASETATSLVYNIIISTFFPVCSIECFACGGECITVNKNDELWQVTVAKDCCAVKVPVIAATIYGPGGLISSACASSPTDFNSPILIISGYMELTIEEANTIPGCDCSLSYDIGSTCYRKCYWRCGGMFYDGSQYVPTELVGTGLGSNSPFRCGADGKCLPPINQDMAGTEAYRFVGSDGPPWHEGCSGPCCKELYKLACP
jgi:hypothetical protein